MQKLWFSLYDFSFDYKGTEPSYIDPKSLRFTAEFEEKFPLIKAELFDYLKEHNPEAYFNASMVNKKSIWKTISLKSWDIVFHKRQKAFPVTSALIQKYPEITSLSFNELEAGGEILPHCGDTNGIYRCHFGIEVPASLPACGFRVRDELRSWEEGKWLIFMDAYNHEAYNKSDKRRIIIVMDVIREEFMNQRNQITSTVLTSLFLQKRAERLKLLYKAPESVIRFVGKCLRPFAFMAMRFVNFVKLY